MINNEFGMLAFSLAGHDKDQIYIILKDDGEYVYLVDGEKRTLDKPKTKRRKHIQIIHQKDEQLIAKMESGLQIRNEEIKRIIKLYKQSKKFSSKAKL